MYTPLLSAAIAMTIAIGGYFLDLWGWILGSIIGVLVFFILGVIIARRVMRRIQPGMERMRKQAEARLFAPAIQSLEDMLPLGRWVPMLHGQLCAQIGVLSDFSGDQEKAIRYLSKSGRRAAEGQMLLASILHRKGETDRALEVLGKATAANKKQVLLHNVYAFLLKKAGRADEAKAVLSRLLKKVKENQATKNNLLRLQNNQKLDMAGFGPEWFMLQLERPPASMGQMQGRKGFRQPKKKAR